MVFVGQGVCYLLTPLPSDNVMGLQRKIGLIQLFQTRINSIDSCHARGLMADINHYRRTRVSSGINLRREGTLLIMTSKLSSRNSFSLHMELGE